MKVLIDNSNSHFLDNFALNWAVLEVLSVKVLASVPSSMSCVSNYWNSHFRFIRKTKRLSGGITHNWILLGVCQFIVLWMICNIVSIQFWSERIDVEKWIFSMIDLCRWHSIQTFKTLISNSWEVHISSFLLDFYTLEPKNWLKNKWE